MNNYFYNRIDDEKILNLKRKIRVLDLGGRDGKFSLPFLEKGHKVTIVDINNKDLEKIKNKYKRNKNFKNLEIVNKDIREYKPRHKFDFIIIRNTLHFLKTKKELDLMLTRIKKYLKKNGILFFTMFGKRHEWVQKGSEKELLACSKKHLLDIMTDMECYEKYENEGWLRAGNGKITYWHSYGFWFINK